MNDKEIYEQWLKDNYGERALKWFKEQFPELDLEDATIRWCSGVFGQSIINKTQSTGMSDMGVIKKEFDRIKDFGWWKRWRNKRKNRKFFKKIMRAGKR